MVNEEYWRKYYKEHPKQGPSNFVHFCVARIPEGSHIVDLAAGDGRDSEILATRGICLPVEPHNDDIQFNTLHEIEYADVVYARWFFHAVEEEVEDFVLQWCQTKSVILMAEMRAEPAEDISHFRRVIEPELFRNKLTQFDFDIDHYEVSRGFSRVGGDDPLLIRVIATHKLRNARAKEKGLERTKYRVVQ